MRTLSWLCLSLVACGPASALKPNVTLTTFNTSVTGLAVEGGFVYWTAIEGSGPVGQLNRMPRAGGEVSRLADGLRDPELVGVDGTSVYVSERTSVVRVPKEGGQPELVFDDADLCREGLLDGAELFVATERRIQRAQLPPVSPLTSTSIVRDQTSVRGLGLSASDVFWVDEKAGGTISSRPRDGSGSTMVVFDAVERGKELALAGTTLWWAARDASTTVLFQGLVTGGMRTQRADFDPNALRATGEGVYVAEGFNLQWVPQAAGEPTLLATEKMLVSAIAIDETHVYWATEGGSANQGVLRRRER